MDFPPGKTEKSKPHGHGEDAGRHPSNSELLASAKLVAEAAKNAASGGSDKVDAGKIAGAAADLLDAAGRYGKLDEMGVGKYLDQAEGYLRKYHASHTTTNSAGHQTATTHASSHPGNDPRPNKHGDPESGDHGHGHGHGHSGGGYGDYVKMAEGFLKKH